MDTILGHINQALQAVSNEYPYLSSTIVVDITDEYITTYGLNSEHIEDIPHIRSIFHDYLSSLGIDIEGTTISHDTPVTISTQDIITIGPMTVYMVRDGNITGYIPMDKVRLVDHIFDNLVSTFN